MLPSQVFCRQPIHQHHSFRIPQGLQGPSHGYLAGHQNIVFLNLLDGGLSHTPPSYLSVREKLKKILSSGAG